MAREIYVYPASLAVSQLANLDLSAPTRAVVQPNLSLPISVMLRGMKEVVESSLFAILQEGSVIFASFMPIAVIFRSPPPILLPLYIGVILV